MLMTRSLSNSGFVDLAGMFALPDRNANATAGGTPLDELSTQLVRFAETSA